MAEQEQFRYRSPLDNIPADVMMKYRAVLVLVYMATLKTVTGLNSVSRQIKEDGIRVLNRPPLGSQQLSQPSSCGYNLKVKAGSPHRLTSPDYPGHYPNNARCTWTFRPTDPKSEVILTCTQFALAPVYLCNKLEDFIVVETPSEPAQWFCGGIGPNNVYGKSLRVTFWSNSKETRKGFSCHVAAVPGGVGSLSADAALVIGGIKGNHHDVVSQTLNLQSSSEEHTKKCYCGVPNLSKRVTRTDSLPEASVTTESPNATLLPSSVAQGMGFDNATEVPGQPRQLILTIPDSKIIKGDPVTPHEFPWLALLEFPSHPGVLCSGALVTSRYVVTAAHCTSHSRDLPIVILGEHDRFNHRDTFRTIRMRAQSVLPHPQYHSPSYDNDIALIKLEREISFDQVTPYISPICAPNPNDKYEYEETFVVGWGSTSEKDRRGSGIPLRASVNTITHQDCARRYYPTTVTENMICAVGKGTDTCQNDSGGPLMARYKGNRFILAGIVSWGIGCARPNYPGVYTRVGNYVDWVQENTRDSRACPPMN